MYVSGRLQRLARKRTIMVWLCYELMFASFMCWIYIRYSTVPRVSGFFKQTWVSFLGYAAWRFFTAWVGMYAVFFRRVHFARLFFFLAALNTVLGVELSLPWVMLDCSCTSYYQCRALGEFVQRGEVLINTYPTPYEASPKVPVEYPPTVVTGQLAQAMTIVQQDEESEDGSNSLGAAQWSWENHSCVPVKPSGLKGGHRKGLDRSAHPPNGAQDPTEGSHPGEANPDNITEKEANNHSWSAFGTEGNLAKEIAMFYTGGRRHNKALIEVEKHLLRPFRYYNLLDPGIRLVSEKSPACFFLQRTAAMSVQKQFRRFQKLYDARRDQLQSIRSVNSELVRALFVCAVDNTCSAVSVGAVAIFKADGTQELYTLTCLENEVLPYVERPEDAAQQMAEVFGPEEGTSGDWIGSKPAVVFQPLQGSQGEALLRTYSQPLANGSSLISSLPLRRLYFLKDVFSAGFLHSEMSGFFHYDGLAAATLTHSRRSHYISRGECRCEHGNNCMAYEAAGRVRYWCYVTTGGLPECFLKGHLVNLEFSTGRWWTHGLCERIGCRCVVSLKEDQSQSYEACPKCWVGLQSTCADRRLVPGMVGGYESAIPCMRSRFPQKAVMSVAEVWCGRVRAGILIMSLVYGIISAAMVIVVFKFVAARCGDFFEMDNNFNVTFSSDSEGDNDFAATGSVKRHVEVEMAVRSSVMDPGMTEAAAKAARAGGDSAAMATAIMMARQASAGSK